MNQSRKIALPRYGEYNCGMKYVVEQGFESTCILPPPLTKRSEELGAKNSPDFVCTPFKTTLGSMIEALEAGADTLVMVYGICRLSYYAELQEQILRDLGYEFDFVNLALYDTGKKKDLLRAAKAINPKANMAKVTKAFAEGIRMTEHLDEITAIYYQNCGFDPSGTYRRAYRTFLTSMYMAQNLLDIEAAYRTAKLTFAETPLEKPEYPLRVGIVGDFYTALDPFSNLEVEQKLADMGVEVWRWTNLTNRMLHYTGDKNLHVSVADRLTYNMGANSISDLWSAQSYAADGFDGILHIKSANCTPEIDIMPVLQNISADYKVPVLYLTYDSQTSDVGLMTRLEAFYDMIEMRKEGCRMKREQAFMGIDVGSISTKGVIIDCDNTILASAYIWTEGNPIGAVKKLVGLLEEQFDKERYDIVGTGTTGSARRLVGTVVGATIVKNEITAHAVGTTTFHPDVRTILEIGGQDSKIILVENGVAVDYAMNTLCAAGTGAFLSSQARRLGIEVEDIGKYALQSMHPTPIAARCTVFAESDLVHKIQMGHPREDIIAGVCNAVAANYLNNVGKGKKIATPVVFQGGVSKNAGVVKAFEDMLHCPVTVDENGHLMGAMGSAILARRGTNRKSFDFNIGSMEFVTREASCGRCSNNCEIICVYRDGQLIDSWGNRCERGAVKIPAAAGM